MNLYFKKRKLWYLYTMGYYSAIKKNTFESVLMRWMKLEPIIQSEVSQKEKYQYSILIHIYGIQKDGKDNLVCETARDTDVQNSLLDSVAEGEGGMIWENGIETCIISYKKRIASPGLIQDAWGWCTGMTRRDCMRREVGGGFRRGNMRMPVVNSC